MTGYRPMTLADLAGRLAREADDRIRWKLVWEFLAALAEHLAARHDLAPPEWADLRVLRRPWFPAELAIQRADALVWAPAAFRKHGVYLSARDLEAA